MRQGAARLKHRMDGTLDGEFWPPSPRRKLAQMPAALQPDRPQIVIEVVQPRRTRHRKIQPKEGRIGILCSQMIDRVAGAGALVSGSAAAIAA